MSAAPINDAPVQQPIGLIEEEPGWDGERNVARRNWNNYQRARDAGHLKYVTEAQKFDRFYLGDQWDDALRQKLESEGKPALTINIIMSAINAALAEHSAHRADIIAKPRLGTDDDAAHVMTQVIDQILDNNQFQAVEQLVVADGLIQDRGFFDVRMDFTDNVLGEVRIRALDPVDVLVDPDAKEYDPRSWNQVIYTRWHTLEEIATLYGLEKAQSLMSLARSGMTLGYDSIRFDVKESRFGDTQYPIYFAADDYQSVVKNVRVIERQSRILARVTQFVDLQTGDTREVPPNWPPERIQAVAQQYGLGVREALARKVRWTVTADWVVLKDEWSPYSNFTIIPYFPVFRRGKSSGAARQLISPQEQLNKVESQTLHVVNTTANSGWITEEGSLANMTAQELEDRGAETGLVLEVRKGRERPEKIQPNSIPTGLDRIGTKALNYIHEISGMQSLMGVMPNADVSGVALAETQSRAVSLLQCASDNLQLSRQLLAYNIVECVQRYYNEPRLFRVTDWRNPEQPTVEVAINQSTPTGEILNNLQLGEYEIIVSTAPLRDGAMESQFAEALQLRNAGVVVPDEYIIRASHLPHKNEIADIVKRLQGRGDPSTEEAQMQQLQMQIQMQMMQAQLAELQAKAQKLAADAQLSISKAQGMGIDAQLSLEKQRSDMAMQLEKLKADLIKHQSNLQNKLTLADKHVAAKADGLLFNAAQRDKDRDLKAEVEMGKTVLQEATKRHVAKQRKLKQKDKP